MKCGPNNNSFGMFGGGNDDDDDDESNKNKEEALKISAEGFLRVDKKSEEIQNRLIEAIDNARNQLKTSIDEFTIEFLKVTDNENALQIKFRITKAKAIEKANEIYNNR